MMRDRGTLTWETADKIALESATRVNRVPCLNAFMSCTHHHRMIAPDSTYLEEPLSSLPMQNLSRSMAYYVVPEVQLF